MDNGLCVHSSPFPTVFIAELHFIHLIQSHLWLKKDYPPRAVTFPAQLLTLDRTLWAGLRQTPQELGLNYTAIFFLP